MADLEHENIERIEWTLQDPEWQPSREYLEKFLAAYKEAAKEIARLRIRVQDAEIALDVWDQSRSSEYWLRHPEVEKA